MTKIRKIIPFSCLPASWGLQGKSRQIAEAEYLLTGYELEEKLLYINADMYSTKEFKTRLIDLLFKHGKIDKKGQMRRLVELIEDEQQKALATLELDFKEGIITDTQYQKSMATLKKEPWITVLNVGFDGKAALEGSFELDWNEYFITDLESKGYVGPTPDSIVNQWFMEVCRNVAMEEFDGTGDFTSDSAANLETMKRWNSSETIPGNRKGHR